MAKLKNLIVETANNCGLSTSYIANAAKLNRCTVNRYKKGTFGVNLDRLQRFLNAVGLRIVLEKIPDREDIYRKDRLFHPPPLPENEKEGI